MPNSVAVRRSCREKKRGGTDRQTDRQTKISAALYSRRLAGYPASLGRKGVREGGEGGREGGEGRGKAERWIDPLGLRNAFNDV